MLGRPSENHDRNPKEMHNRLHVPSDHPENPGGGEFFREKTTERTPGGEDLTFRTNSLISILPSKKPKRILGGVFSMDLTQGCG